MRASVCADVHARERQTDTERERNRGREPVTVTERQRQRQGKQRETEEEREDCDPVLAYSRHKPQAVCSLLAGQRQSQPQLLFSKTTT